MLLYKQDYVIEATIKNGNITFDDESNSADSDYTDQTALVFLPDPTNGWIEHGATVDFEKEEGKENSYTGQLEDSFNIL